MMTSDDITETLKMLTANYGDDFYKNTDEMQVIKLWSVQFANDDPKDVMQAVMNCIATLSYRPKIADIRKRMAGNAIKGQMTSTEAFQRISKAVEDASDRTSAAHAYNDLPPILRKVTGSPSQLISWHRVSDEAFQTVIMSAIRESYRELAQREADYYALPVPLKNAEKWRINAPKQETLPEPETAKTITEIVDEANRKAALHGMVMTEELREKHRDGLNVFLAPMSKDEIRIVQKRKEQKAERYL